MKFKMMDAQTAYKESLYRGEANNILECIVAGIERECEEGYFEHEERMNVVSDEVLELVRTDLEENGYKVNIENIYDGISIIVDWRCGGK